MNNLMIVNALLISLAVATATGPLWIPFFRRLKFGQYIREEGPQAHLAKAGTPTFGGAIFIFSTLLTAAVLTDLTPSVIGILVAVAGFAAIGFLDDYTKVVMKHNQGLSAKAKIVGLFAVTAVLYLLFFRDHVSVFYFDAFRIRGIAWAIVFFFIAIATTNAVNLTDGIDGLCGTVSTIVALFFMAVSLKRGNYDLALCNALFAGSLVGYLIYNWHPAKIFMGDMGSLALGGYVLVNAVQLGIEWWIPLFGIVYVIETISVMIQVAYFKSTGGKRFFKMTPIHHHFELSGWSELKIVVAFGAVAALACLATYLIV